MDILLIDSFGLKIEANLYLNIFKPRVSTKVVTSVDAALKEIDLYKEKHTSNVG